MASGQERLRTDLDNWSTREQLCLASAVSCSGDQNWMYVSRTLKLVCGNDTNNHPSDWFSQKSCAIKYAQLLENVEMTPKRRKRTSENNSSADSPSIAETSPDIILRLLTEERVQELKTEISNEQEEYAKIYNELKAMQSDQLSEERLLEMWHDIEKQQEMQRIEEMKMENILREREQRKQEMQRNWKPITVTNVTAKPSTDIHRVDISIENEQSTGRAVNVSNQQQQQQFLQSGTSPLLSSLLKSPTAGAASTPPTFAAVSATRAAATAPTITTLLTSGSIPNANLPAITLRNSIPSSEAAQILTRPISGPFGDTLTNPSASSTQILLSPSQSAPTLSMLLEKNKSLSLINNEQNSTLLKAENSESENNDAMKTDSNNDEVPMDIEGDIAADLVKTRTDLTIATDSDGSDPNEEQLLEVFKNIGNIDEFEDIDVAAVIDDEGVDFLKGVDEETVTNSNAIEFESKFDIAEAKNAKTQEQSKDLENPKEDTKPQIKQEQTDINEKNYRKNITNLSIEKASVKSEENAKIETISSDDSNDNIPLSAVASLENKDRSHGLDEEELQTENKLKDPESKNETKTEQIKDFDNTSNTSMSAMKSNVDEKESKVEEKFTNENENNEDIIIIPTDDDDSSGDRSSIQHQATDSAVKSTDAQNESSLEYKEKISFEHDVIAKSQSTSICIENIDESTREETEEASALDDDVTTVSILPPPTMMSIADTDEDSSTTDVSIITRKEDKISSPIKAAQHHHQLELRSNESKPDDETAATHAKPPVLRKLRDRDRSESPMIDNEVINSSEHQHLISQRLRRRYSSSTPVMDSIPNSPASSERDDIEAKVSKKYLISIYNTLLHNKNVTVFQRAFNEERNPKHNEICLRIMDLPTIRKNIESGVIKSVNELHRDILLMCQNALMVLKTNSNDYKIVLLFIHECQSIRELTITTTTITNSNISECTTKLEKDTKESKSISSVHNTSGGGGVKVRGSSRKSQRISCPT